MKRAEFERQEAKRQRWQTAFQFVVLIACLLLALYFYLPVDSIGPLTPHKAEARNEVVNLVRSVRAYEMEYSRLPLPEGTTADVTTETDEEFMAILLGAGGVALNPRGKVFYTGKSAKKGRTGLLDVDPKLGPKLVDPWGRPYVMLVDGDGDGAVTAPGGATITQAQICYSLGEDGVFDAKDPKSW